MILQSFAVKFRVVALVFVLALMGSPHRAYASEIEKYSPESTVRALSVRLLTEDYPPYNYLDDIGLLRGVGAEVVQAMSAHLGYSRGIQLIAWKRVLKLVNEEANIGVFSMTRTVPREEKYHWVGPIVTATVGVFQLRNSKNPVHNIQEMRSVGSIGVQAGGAHEQALVSHGFTNLEPIYNQRSGVQMLAAGRIDLLVSADIELFHQLNSSPLERDDLEMVYQFSIGDLYLAFSKRTPDDVVNVWQEAYDHVVASGQYERIMSQYGVVVGHAPRIKGPIPEGQ